ncbi:hypothetical protein [Peterkaempfera sp. SMS 1(5)a]|uniref:hypothetical protein n=1 Tax=Peterkaempfera podocarpi TaxID=3232308 RepID=UPI0036728E1B
MADRGVAGQGEGWKARAWRTGWLAFWLWAGWRMVERSRPTMAVLAVALLVAGWRAEGAAAEAEGDVEEPEEQPAAPVEEQRAYVLGVIRGLIGDRTGVHVTDIRDALVDRGSIPAGLRTSTVRLSLERLGIPVRDQLNLGRTNRPGVHAADLAAAGGGEAVPTPPHLVLIRDTGSSAA